MAHDQKVEGSNPPHRKLDGCEQFASYYIKENLTINAAKWDAQTKNIKNWNIKWIYFIKAKSKYFNFKLGHTEAELIAIELLFVSTFNYE